MFFSKLFILCLLYYHLSSAEDNVLEFNDEDIDTKLHKLETTLVLFYAPWCNHCKKLKPEFAKAASELIKNKPPVTLIQVDCIREGRQTCEKYEITAYPSLKIFQNGKFEKDYKGERQSQDIVNYMKFHLNSDVNNINDLDEFLNDQVKVAVVGFFEEQSSLKTALHKAFNKLRHKVMFAECLDKTILTKRALFNNIILFRPRHLHNIFEEDSVIYSGPASASDLESFIEENYHGLVGHRKIENKNEFHNPLVVAYYNVDYVKDPKGTNYWRNRVLKVAKDFKGRINFAISDRDEFQHDLRQFDITYNYTKDDKPTVLARDATNQRFIMTKNFSSDNLHHFVTQLVEGRLKPYIKSQPVPRTNTGLVKVAVADNFDAVVINNCKDTLIAFYAPWCGNCKRLGPLYDELGEEMKDENIDIVKMDATGNDIPSQFAVDGFPSLYLLLKNAKDKPIPYTDTLTVDSVIKFVAEKATDELKGYDRKGKRRAISPEVKTAANVSSVPEMKAAPEETPVPEVKTEL